MFSNFIKMELYCIYSTATYFFHSILFFTREWVFLAWSYKSFIFTSTWIPLYEYTKIYLSIVDGQLDYCQFSLFQTFLVWPFSPISWYTYVYIKYYVCSCVYMCIYVCVSVLVYICVYMHVCSAGTYMYVCMCVCMRGVGAYVWVCVWGVCINVCTYMYVCMHPWELPGQRIWSSETFLNNTT